MEILYMPLEDDKITTTGSRRFLQVRKNWMNLDIVTPVQNRF
jgi:predicted P-loop ATPase